MDADSAHANGGEQPGAAGKAGAAKGKKRPRSPAKDGDAAAAQLLALGSRPSRKAAATAAAKIAQQSQNLSISKLAEEAAAAEATAGGGKPGKGGAGRGKASAASGGDGDEQQQQQQGKGRGRGKGKRQTQPYLLPCDQVSGEWQLVADSIEGVTALGEQLAASPAAADAELGQLLLGQVVATLLERQQQEEKVRGSMAAWRVAAPCGSARPCVAWGAAPARSNPPRS
jgi:hypothetical protein